MDIYKANSLVNMSEKSKTDSSIWNEHAKAVMSLITCQEYCPGNSERLLSSKIKTVGW